MYDGWEGVKVTKKGRVKLPRVLGEISRYLDGSALKVRVRVRENRGTLGQGNKEPD